MTLQVVAFYPWRAKRWGERQTLMVTPQRPCRPFRLVAGEGAARDYLILGLNIACQEIFGGAYVPASLFTAPSLMPNWHSPLLRESTRAELEVLASYVAPRSPWLRGSRAARKAARVRFWRREAARLPAEFACALLCEAVP